MTLKVIVCALACLVLTGCLELISGYVGVLEGDIRWERCNKIAMYKATSQAEVDARHARCMMEAEAADKQREIDVYVH